MITPVVGKSYDLSHIRKGKFSILILGISGAAVTGKIFKGIARYASEPSRSKGDLITLNPNSPVCKILCESDESSNGS